MPSNSRRPRSARVAKNGLAACCLAVCVLSALSSCSKDGKAAATTLPDAYALSISAVDTRFDTRDHFIASVEMQLSGEPFATAMGRDVSLYNRDYVCQKSVCSADSYSDPTLTSDAGAPAETIDLAGFSTAIESYEYSKQPMNNVAFESGAGTSLVFGPLFNPAGAPTAQGAAALQPLQAWIRALGDATNASGRARIDDDDPLGWPGLQPTLQPFVSWDPTIEPTHEGGCSLTSDDNHGPHSGLSSNVYECDYRSLNLPDRNAQVTKTIGPGASGWSDWKQALWTLNYLQLMHDVKETPIDHVTESLLSNVGTPGNTTGSGVHPGTYLGSSDIEGFQAGNFLQIFDNQAEQWLFALTTSDGAALGGFGSLSEALAYRPDSPARWFPAAISVREEDDASGFPRPVEYRIDSADSQLLDLTGLLGAYASVYALTDQANAAVGGSQAVRAYFDGDPLPAQPQTVTGAPFLHDRALAMLRVLLVNIDRFHASEDGASFYDAATLHDGKLTHGDVLSTDVAAYALLGLRTARRGLDSELTLYSNTTADTAGIPLPLDQFTWQDGVTYSQRLERLIRGLASVFYEKLTTADGRAFGGWDAARNAPTDAATDLDAHAAAVRGLLVAYLATGSTEYRERALRVWERLDKVFYDPAARAYRPTEGDHSSELTFTPRRFGLLQGALRDAYELMALLPGKQDMRALLEERVGRLNKLVLNGWDDRNRDGKVDWPGECAHVGTGPDGEPLGLGGLQMAERTLSGESGAIPSDTDDDTRVRASDREHDCVPEISAVGLPSALARSVTFQLTPLMAADAGQP